jgi:cobalt-zinc-cadmium efflux system membrane fusion protein
MRFANGSKFVSRVAFICLLSGIPSLATAATLSLTQEQMDNLGVTTAPVTTAVTQTTTSALGHVMPALNARVPVPAPFSGTVVAVDVLEGAEVKAGDTLAVLASRDVREARAQLQSLEAQHRAAAAAAARSSQLAGEGIVSRARSEEDASRAAATAADYAAVREILSRTNSVAGTPDMYRLVSPVDGRVARIEVLPGGAIGEMDTAVLLDTGSELWIEARLPASDVGNVKVGDGILVEGRGIRGEVVAVGTSIDPLTRSAVLRAAVSPDAHLIAGETVRISILDDAESGTLSVPRGAVVSLDGGFAVFVVREGGFDVIPVEVMATGATEIALLGPIEPNELVAISGLTELKALALLD